MAPEASTSSQDLEHLLSRVDATYLLDQRERVNAESFTDWKDRLSSVMDLAVGKLLAKRGTTPKGGVGMITPTMTSPPGLDDTLVVENLIKNAMLDTASLATDAQATITAVQRGSTADAKKERVLKEAIAHTVLWAGRFDRIRTSLYLDLIKSGVMAVATYYTDEPYAQFARLDPLGCYPTVRNGKIIDMLYVEKVKLRDLEFEYPEAITDVPLDKVDKEVERIDYYNDEEVVKALVFTQDGKVPRDGHSRVVIVDRWVHNLGRVPVAFESLDTIDGAFRGLMDQASGPFLAKNAITTYLLEYIEDMVHAPLEEKNIIGGAEDQQPGPNTIYHHDPNAQESFLRRVPPAAPAGAVFGLTQFLDRSISGEVNQPPSRQGDVKQSIATGSFVDKTQGRLTSVVRNLQDLMGYLMEDLVTLLYKIEKSELNFEKPLWQPVGRKYTYTPETDLGDFIYVRVEHGAAAGLDRSQADIRILEHLGAKLLDKGTARSQIDYLRDDIDLQNRIDAEAVAEARMQRFAADPRMDISTLIKFELAIADGKSSIEALKAALPEVQASEQAAKDAANPQAAGQGGPPPGADEMAGAAAAQGGQPQMPPGQAPAQGDMLPLDFARPPLQQQVVRIQ